MAGLRNQAEVALGNVIGSNIFNLLGIIGVTTLFDEFCVLQLLCPRYLGHAGIGAGFDTLCVLKWRMSRSIGALFLGAYTLYLASMM